MIATTMDDAAEHATIERLSAYLDDELNAEEAQRLACHLEGCERCHQRLAGLRDVASSLRRLDKVPPPVGLEHMVVRRIALEEKSPRAFDRFETLLSGFGRQSPVLSLFAVVIALATMFLLFSQAVHQRRQETTPILFEPPTADVGGNVDGEVVLQRVIADRRLVRTEEGWLQEGVDRKSVERSLIKSSRHGKAFFSEHPELRELRMLTDPVIIQLDGEVIELR